MVNYYIVSRNPNTNEYKSIMIGDSSVLENIDLYTLNFNNKEELIRDINSYGYNLSNEDDLFIASLGRSHDLKIKNILYNGKYISNIRDIALASKNKEEFDYRPIFNTTYKLCKKHSLYSGLFYSSKLYKPFKDIIYQTISMFGKIGKDGNKVFNRDNYWLRSSYQLMRDVCVSFNLYESIEGKVDLDDLSNVVKEEELIDKSRRGLTNDLVRTLENGFGQMSFLGGPDEFIHITSIHPHKVPENGVLSRKVNTGEIKSVPEIEVTDTPEVAIGVENSEFKLDMSSIRKINLHDKSEREKNKARTEIIDLLTDEKYMPYGSIGYDGERYYFNFDSFNYDYSFSDKKMISGMMSQALMRNIFFYNFYRERLDNYPLESSEIYEEKTHYYNQIHKLVTTSTKKSDRVLNNLYRFYTIQKDVVEKKGKRK
jgi:hypothetical protein